LPDGTRSFVPPEWTDHGSFMSEHAQTAALASMDELLHLRTIVDALLQARRHHRAISRR